MEKKKIAARLALIDRLKAAEEKISYQSAEFNIMAMYGDKRVSKSRDGYLAVDKKTRKPLGFATHNDRYWVVTHLLSGHRIDNLYPYTRKQALAAIGVLLEIGGAIWEKENPLADIDENVHKQIQQLLRDLNSLWR